MKRGKLFLRNRMFVIIFSAGKILFSPTRIKSTAWSMQRGQAGRGVGPGNGFQLTKLGLEGRGRFWILGAGDKVQRLTMNTGGCALKQMSLGPRNYSLLREEGVRRKLEEMARERG